MSIQKEALSMISNGIIEPFRKERLNPEQAGLKEFISSTEFLAAKKGGREPGVHKWGRR